MSADERQAFQDQVEKGGEVDSGGLADRMREAYLLAYAVQGDQIVAVGAVKRPADSYVRKISRRSGVDLNGYTAELGWIHVMPEFRGQHLASRISEGLCSSSVSFRQSCVT